MRIIAIHKKYLENIHISNPENYPFNNFFGNDNWRISFPLYNEEIKKIINLLESGLTRSKRKYILDIKNDVAFVENDPRPRRLGKVINNELGKKWADEWSKQKASINLNEESGNYIIIISRHPYDVVRMSDFKNISSCHSPGDTYFSCAIQEASHGGPIAYIIHYKDYLKIKDSLQDDNIFNDEDRDISEKAEPIARIRFNRYVSKKDDDEEMMIPVPKIYGIRVSGFYESILAWAKNMQPNISYENPEMKEWIRKGGDYADYNDGSIWNNFFGTDKYAGNATHESETSSLSELWEEEVETIMAEAEDLQYVIPFASVDISDGAVFIQSDAKILFRFQNVISENIPMKTIDFYGKKIIDHGEIGIPYDQNILRNVRSLVDHSIDFGNANGVEWELKNNVLECVVDIGFSTENPDDLRLSIESMRQWEKNKYQKLYYEINSKLIEAGYIEERYIEEFFKNYKFKNLDIVQDEDSGLYSINSSIFTLVIPSSLEAKTREIENNLYQYIKQLVQNLYDQNIKNFLFEIEDNQIDFSSIPDPLIRLNNVPKYDFKYDAFGRGRKTVLNDPPMYSELTMSFSIFLSNLINVDDRNFITFLKYLDNYFQEIIFNVRKKTEEEIKKYTQQQETINKSNSSWYKIIKK